MARLRGEQKRAWESTMRLYDRLTAGGTPAVFDIDYLELGPDEVCYAESDLLLSTPGRVERSVIYEEVQRPFTLNPLRRARDARDRAANRAEFERLSRELAEAPEIMWFEQGLVRVLVTNDRLVFHHDGRWWEYRRTDLTHLEFDIDEWSIEVRYGSDPIRFTGWDAIGVGLILIWLQDGPDAIADIGLGNMR